jgi:hypothetical protein
MLKCFGAAAANGQQLSYPFSDREAFGSGLWHCLQQL